MGEIREKEREKGVREIDGLDGGTDGYVSGTTTTKEQHEMFFVSFVDYHSYVVADIGVMAVVVNWWIDGLRC